MATLSKSFTAFTNRFRFVYGFGTDELEPSRGTVYQRGVGPVPAVVLRSSFVKPTWPATAFSANPNVKQYGPNFYDVVANTGTVVQTGAASQSGAPEYGNYQATAQTTANIPPYTRSASVFDNDSTPYNPYEGQVIQPTPPIILGWTANYTFTPPTFCKWESVGDGAFTPRFTLLNAFPRYGDRSGRAVPFNGFSGGYYLVGMTDLVLRVGGQIFGLTEQPNADGITMDAVADLPRTANGSVEWNAYFEDGYEFGWVPLALGPLSSIVVSDKENEDSFVADYGFSLDIDDGIASISAKVVLNSNSNNPLDRVDWSAAGTPEGESTTAFRFRWDLLDTLFEARGYARPTAVSLFVIVTDAGGLVDSTMVSVVRPIVATAQIGAVQSASGRLTFATIEGGAMKIRGGELQSNGIKLEVLNSVSSVSAPSLSLARDNSLLRSYRTASGGVTLDRSRDGGKTWQ